VKILVTGGAGFIGSTLVGQLLPLGHEVTCLDNFDGWYDPHVRRLNIAAAVRSSRFDLVEGDIRDEALVERLLARRYDAVIHLAARPGVRSSIASPALYERINVQGTITLLESSRRHGVSHFLFASSSSVYGLSRDVPFHEETSRLAPASPYGVTKLAAEFFCRTYHHLYGMPITCLRFFTVYGPRQRPDMAIHRFTRLIEQGSPIPVYGDGTARRDFTYVGDVVDGVVRALTRPRGFRIYNLGTSDIVMVRELVTMIERALGKRAVVVSHPAQAGDVPITYADITLAGRELGYRPSTPLAAGLGKFVEWLRGLEAPAPAAPSRGLPAADPVRGVPLPAAGATPRRRTVGAGRLETRPT
jgi:UDP-glucuronate 4-epimerase